ncbi:polyprenyl synthetase family protein [Paroceanicella profunda]|uniref:Geranylgeranyl diphosphate synthase n=1 Tax=Paroceanicella profunda TaxID=2579971 RepID=A0A5B8FIS9_9RHOB|nr:farnesyl diphosphate synthase [Paroceanicella profunda]QDL93587.1 polyprenyl synthetase family protein [Paroceanicella profunda]
MSFVDILTRTAERVERRAEALLPLPAGPEGQVAAAMRHAVLGGGKRLRGFLVVSSAAIYDVAPERAERAAVALECLHAYSLVHDDLPCMDDDSLRRGQPTVHVKWDEATAVLAGDALQSLAFEILAHPDTHPDGAVRAALCLDLARASGQRGMVGGQAIDIAAETAGSPLSLAEIGRLQALKTGALIRAATRAGALLGGASVEDIEALDGYAEVLGRAFQIRDDILDVAGDPALAGKRLRKDAAAGKATFVSLLGLDEAARQADLLVAQATARLDRFGAVADPLREAARFAVARQS